MIDYETASDEEIRRALAALEAGQPVQPVNAQTGEPLAQPQAQAAASIAAQGGYRPQSVPGGPMAPRAQISPADQPPPSEFYIDPQGQVRQAAPDERDVSNELMRRQIQGATPFVGPFMQHMDRDRMRALGRGIPVVGEWLDEANAKSAAAAAPGVEPVMRWLQERNIDVGYDPQYRLDNITDPREREQAALMMQRQLDQSYDARSPVESPVLRGTGTGLGLAAGILGPGSALVPLTSRLPAGAGLLPQMGVGALEGGAYLGAQMAGAGEGDLLDPSRLDKGVMGAVTGGAGGGAMPLAIKAGGAAWNATAGRVIDRLRGGVRDPGAIAEEAIPQVMRAADPNLELPPGLQPVNAADNAEQAIAEVLAARANRAPAAVQPSAEDDAYARIGRAMMRARQTPDQLVDRVETIGPLGMVADTSDAMRNLTRDALNRPSGAEDIIRKALEARQRGIYDPMEGKYAVRPSSLRLLDNAATGMGLEGRTYHAQFDVLNKLQREMADPLYAQVRELGPTYSPTLNALETRPSVKRAKLRAYRIAREEGRDPEALGLSEVEVPGAWDSEVDALSASAAKAPRGPSKAPAKGPSLAKYIADGGGLRDVGGDLAAMDAQAWHKGKAYQKPLIGEGAAADDWALRAWEAGYFPDLVERPTERQLLDALQRELRGKPVFARAPEAGAQQRFEARQAADELAYRGAADPPPAPDDYVGRPEPQTEVAWQVEPTAETWDYIKRGLDDELTPYREGKKAWDEEGRAISRTLQELRGELVSLNPVYGEALEAWSGPAAMKDAMEAGKRFARQDAEGLGVSLGDMTSGERQMYRIGVVQGLKDKLGGADVTYDAARNAGLLKPNQLERFRQIFPTARSFADFVKTMEGEQAMFATRSAALQGSTTAKQLLAAQDNDDAQITQALAAGISAKTGNPMPIVTMLRDWGGAERKMPAPTAEALASILTNMNPAALPIVRSRLAQAQAAQEVADRLREMSVAGGAQAASAATQR